MRIVLVLATLVSATACGQTGSLYLPDASSETPVEIRTPAPRVPVPATEDKEKKNTQPPGG